MTVNLKLKGLTCEHCAASVREELEEIPGTISVNVDVVKDGISTATYEAKEPVDEGAIREAINEAGYELVSID